MLHCITQLKNCVFVPIRSGSCKNAQRIRKGMFNLCDSRLAASVLRGCRMRDVRVAASRFFAVQFWLYKFGVTKYTPKYSEIHRKVSKNCQTHQKILKQSWIFLDEPFSSKRELTRILPLLFQVPSTGPPTPRGSGFVGPNPRTLALQRHGTEHL